MTRRSDDDILNTDRVFFQMIRDYSDGLLGPRPLYHRARVEASDPEGGKLEASPPNPARSVRARVYSAGLDATTPREALVIFYPLNAGGCPQPGEHVIISYETEDMTSGYWHSVVPSFHDTNYANPDFRETTRRDASHVFEGDPQVTTSTPTDFEYGGSTTQTQGRQEMVDLAESQGATNPWQNKKVLAIGDSQMAGPFGAQLGEALRGQHGVTQYIRDGRTSWGVISWLRGRLRPDSEQKATLNQLITQHRPDIIVMSLGGNDGSGAARRADYEAKVRELYGQAVAPMVIWCGPPVAVAAASERQPGRDLAARKILQVVGAEHFVDVRSVTNTTNGRSPDGVHFTAASTAIAPWVDLVIRKGYAMARR